MTKVSVRELRNRGGHVLDRVERGERVTITRDGREVAELRPIARDVSAAVLIERRRGLPDLNPVGLRRDLDRVLDSGL